MGTRATTRPHDAFMALEKATPFSSHFFSICWGIVVISMQWPRSMVPAGVRQCTTCGTVRGSSGGGVQEKGPQLSSREVWSQRKYHRGGDSKDDISQTDQVIYSNELKTGPQARTRTWIFTAALFTNSHPRDTAQAPTSRWWVETPNVVYPHNRFFSHKKNEVLKHNRDKPQKHHGQGKKPDAKGPYIIVFVWNVWNR